MLPVVFMGMLIVDIKDVTREACPRFVRRFPIPEETAFEALLMFVVQYDEFAHLYHHLDHCEQKQAKVNKKSKNEQKKA